LVAIKQIRTYREEFDIPENLHYFNIGKEVAKQIDDDLINARESKFAKHTV